MGADPSLTEGSVVAGTYLLGAVLGTGGQGSVYAARQLRTGAEVALKLLDARDGAATQRFLREARIAMRLSHPAIVRVLDAGFAEDGVPYVAYERLEGASLERWLTGAPLGEARALQVVRPLLGALAEAHEAGIVHRDVKPENLFVCGAGRSGEETIKLLDFGVAKSAFSSTVQTAAGLVLGTPLYMAPEQMTGEPIGPWTDLYAAGLVLAELLSGRTVFEPSLAALVAAKTGDAPIVFDERVRASRLLAVVERATRRWPAHRFTSAKEMLDAIDRATKPARPAPPRTTPMPASPSEAPPKPIDPLGATLGSDELAAALGGDVLAATMGSDPLAETATEARPASVDGPSPRRRWVAWAAVSLLVVVAVLASAYVLARRARQPSGARFDSAAVGGFGGVGAVDGGGARRLAQPARLAPP